MACNNTIQLSLTLSQSCPVPEAVKAEIAKDSNLKMLGCLVAFWQSQPLSADYGQPVSISPNGVAELVKRDDDTNNLNLPPSALDHPLLFRLYLFTAERSKALANDPNGHDQLCRSMKSTSYDCFGNTKDCLMAFELQPDAVFRGRQLQAKPISSDGNARCRACVHEVCGDGIDNDCNGRVDDIDSLKKVQCTKTD